MKVFVVAAFTAAIARVESDGERRLTSRARVAR
jgi:hypothetical protein